jgi:phosphatidylglycerophosphatase A
MTAKTDARSSGPPSAVQPRKPRFAIFLATAGGLGYFPKAPGTLGSLAGLALAMLPIWSSSLLPTLALDLPQKGETLGFHRPSAAIDPMLLAQIALTIVVALVGVWASSRAAAFWRQKDPQRVVIDEVSGQHLTILLGCILPMLWHSSSAAHTAVPIGMLTLNSPLGWKYLLVGFILFRLFDIWKPFPARQAESLPGGWGIMADDWIAGVYAAICLWLARSAGL